MYLFAIEEVKTLQNPNQIYSFLFAVGMCSGICLLIGRLKNTENFTMSEQWVSKYTRKDAYWGMTPNDYNFEKEGTLRALKLRVRNLKKELQLV